MPIGLYIHIPFCSKPCPYCDFAFEVGKNSLATPYTQAVVKEFRTRLPKPAPCFETLFFGGGTPSAIPAEALENILNTVRTEATIPSDAEITAEANPNDSSRFGDLRKIGINRLSLGVQALDDRDLVALGRNHSSGEAVSAFQIARESGFENIGIDLIFGVPGQSVNRWRKTLEQALALKPNHISVYGLTIESGTAFGRRQEKGRLTLPPEGDQAEMYNLALDLLGEFVHYEISNFALPGFASRHNLSCWEGRPYLGIGVSAHSFLDQHRSWNVRNLDDYLHRIETGSSAKEGEEFIGNDQRELEHIMLGLRQRKGIPESSLPNHSSVDNLLSNHILVRENGHIRLSRRGLLLADLVCAELVKEA